MQSVGSGEHCWPTMEAGRRPVTESSLPAGAAKVGPLAGEIFRYATVKAPATWAVRTWSRSNGTTRRAKGRTLSAACLGLASPLLRP
jgi:hypothetical protein